MSCLSGPWVRVTLTHGADISSQRDINRQGERDVIDRSWKRDMKTERG